MKKLFYILLFFATTLFSQTNEWTVTWYANTESDMAKYLVFRDTSPNAITQIATVNHPTVEYTDNTIQKGIIYYYRLKAEDTSFNQSGFSNEISAAIPRIELTSFTYENLSSHTVGFDSLFVDPDNVDSEMVVTISSESNCNVTVVSETIVIDPAATNFVGQATFTLNVADPTGFEDQRNVTVEFTSAAPAAPILINITR